MTAATKIHQKITYCLNILDRTTTGAGERQAAEQALARLRAKLNETAASTYNDRRFYGAKYADTKNLTLTEIAKRIRADIKFARKMASETATTAAALAVADSLADVPKQIKVSVRTSYYSGGGSIDINLRNVPAEWGITTKSEPYEHEAPTAALKAFAIALKEIMTAYNYNGSDLLTDYHDVRFYGGVSIDGWRIA